MAVVTSMGKHFWMIKEIIVAIKPRKTIKPWMLEHILQSG